MSLAQIGRSLQTLSKAEMYPNGSNPQHHHNLELSSAPVKIKTRTIIKYYEQITEKQGGRDCRSDIKKSPPSSADEHRAVIPR